MISGRDMWQAEKPEIFQCRNGERKIWVALIPVRVGESLNVGVFGDWEHARKFIVKNYHKKHLVPGQLRAPDIDATRRVCSLCGAKVQSENGYLRVCTKCDTMWDIDGENGEKGWRWVNRFNRGEPEEEGGEYVFYP